MKTLVLGLGNDLIGDDGIGLLVARKLAANRSGAVDVVESNLCGLALLELLIGYERAIIIDAMHTGRYRPGTVVEMGPENISSVTNPSPHYAGLPELMRLAGELGLDFPKDMRVFAIEAGDMRTMGGGLTREVADALIPAADRIRAYLEKPGMGGAVA